MTVNFIKVRRPLISFPPVDSVAPAPHPPPSLIALAESPPSYLGRSIFARGGIAADPFPKPRFVFAESPRPDPGIVRSFAGTIPAITPAPHPPPTAYVVAESPPPFPGWTVDLIGGIAADPLPLARVAVTESPRPHPGAAIFLVNTVDSVSPSPTSPPAVIVSSQPPPSYPGWWTRLIGTEVFADSIPRSHLVGSEVSRPHPVATISFAGTVPSVAPSPTAPIVVAYLAEQNLGLGSILHLTAMAEPPAVEPTARIIVVVAKDREPWPGWAFWLKGFAESLVPVIVVPPCPYRPGTTDAPDSTDSSIEDQTILIASFQDQDARIDAVDAGTGPSATSVEDAPMLFSSAEQIDFRPGSVEDIGQFATTSDFGFAYQSSVEDNSTDAQSAEGTEDERDHGVDEGDSRSTKRDECS